MLPLVAVLGAMAAARARAEGYSAIDFLGASHTVLRAAAQRKAGDTTFVAVGRTWDSTSTPPGYRALLASYQVLDGGQDIPFAGGNGQLGKIVVDLAGNGFDNLCNAVTYAYDGYIAACRSMNGLAWYDLYLVKFTAAGVLDTTFGTNGVAATGVGGDATDGHALPRGIVYNGGTNLANGGVVTVVGALGKFSPGDFHPFIASFDQKTGAQIGPTVTSSLVGTATAVTFDGAAGGVGYYYVASTETSGTKTFYIDRYNVDLDVSTAPWGSAIDFSAAGGGTDSVPAGIAVYNADVVAVGGNRSGAGAWRCAAVAVKMADGNLDTAFGSATIAGGVDDKGITLFPNPTNASYDCILNAVATPPSGGALVVGGTAYVDHTGIFNYDHLLAELNPTGDFVTTFDLDGIKIQALGGADDVINSLLFFDNVGKVYGIGRSQNTSQTNGATAAEVWTTMAAIENWSASTTTNAPAPRYDATGVWTGSTLVVWGGVNDSSDPQNTGGVYDPAGNAWTAMTTTNAPEPRDSFHSVWTGTHMIVFGGYSGITTFNDGGRYDPASNTWNPMSTTNAPPPRIEGNIVWTGARMIAWGGQDSSDMNTGGIYDPKGNAWTPMTTVGAPSPRHEHAGVWTGSKMIVWGGYPSGVTNDGGIYDPSANSWAPTSTTNAPGGRQYHAAVWTGSQLLVWGGYNATDRLNTGGVLAPISLTAGGPGGTFTTNTSDTWTAMTTANAPASRYAAAGTWSGTKFVAWGGNTGAAYLNTGGSFDLTTKTWSAVATANAPSKRGFFSATWVGSKALVWGGYGGTDLNNGGLYDPVANSWTATSTTNAPSKRNAYTATWSGTQYLVFGGASPDPTPVNSGGRYEPATDKWYRMSTTNAPPPRFYSSSVWTGSKMIVWGGSIVSGTGGTSLATGGVYDPSLDKWTPMTTTGAPASGACLHSTTWLSGLGKMFYWGGQSSNCGAITFAVASYLNQGALYDLANNAWTTLPTGNGPGRRSQHIAGWNGAKVYVWGGQGAPAAAQAGLNTGAVYDPSAGTWSTMTASTTNHVDPAMTWTGAKLIVWGGRPNATSSTPNNIGYYYTP